MIIECSIDRQNLPEAEAKARDCWRERVAIRVAVGANLAIEAISSAN
jgi:hypothetical protein